MSKEELLEYLEDISQQLDNIALDQIQFAISELQFFKEEYKKLEEENKRIKNSNDTLKSFVSSIFNDTFEKDFIPTSVIQNKIEELNRRIDYLNTELNKCYIEREKLGTETDIDNNETAIFCMEQEREYRYEQKQVLEEILEEGRNNK